MVARAGLSNSSLGFDSDIKVDLPQSLNQLLVELENASYDDDDI